MQPERERTKDCAYIIEYIAVGERAIGEPADGAGEHKRAGEEHRHAGDDRQLSGRERGAPRISDETADHGRGIGVIGGGFPLRDHAGDLRADRGRGAERRPVH